MTTPGLLLLERVPITHPDAQRLIEEVQAEYVRRYGGPDSTPLDPGMFEEPAGAFFVGYVDAVPVATGAWRRSTVPALGETSTAEIKRMYVASAAPAARVTLGVVLAHLEATAAAAGARAMILETGTAQPEAIALYASSGYVPVPGFGHYRDAPLSRCFGKLLVP